MAEPQQPNVVGMCSSGIASWMAMRLYIDEHGSDHMVALFADVKGNNPSPHAGEDADNYRFLADCVADLGVPLITLNQGEDIWDVFRRRRRIGSSYAANCSEELKQKPAKRWLKEHAHINTEIIIGIDWTETHRIPAVERAYFPRMVRFPLVDARLTKDDMLAAARARGLEPPRLYRTGVGLNHANCGGFCVRAGQAQFAALLREHPARFAYHEEQEERTRVYLGKDVSILNDRRGGTTTPLTLRRFRERLETGQTEMFDPLDIGGCGCFVDENPVGDGKGKTLDPAGPVVDPTAERTYPDVATPSPFAASTDASLGSRGSLLLTFIAHGTPVGQGNIRHLGKGRPAIHQNAKTLLPWRDTIRHAAITAIGDSAGFPYDEPLRIDATFTVPKPTGAPKTRRIWPSKRPDLDHMIRACLDAITHVVVTDDARAVELRAAKRYPLEGADALTYPGVIVRIYRIADLTGTP